jgi:hypothetical protein
MYTILINNDNTLTKSIETRIMHRSNMVDKIHFLCEPKYNEYDMSEFTVALEYKTPISATYRVEVLSPSEELYKERLEYMLPVDTNITSEVGDIELKFKFTNIEMQPDGSVIERVRETDTTTITVLPVSKWDEYISNSDLGSLAEILLNIQAQSIKQADLAEQLNASKADDLAVDVENNKLYATSNGKIIGTGVNLDDLGDALAEATDDGLIRVII